ncbi:unnamed protein product [Darwinula stevensoni]|uniref:Uncharacterized protein n=1 Tax=Darwinula stevensoni TaxID=69355 RepID=A0A7R9ABM9_9CRUS|nr:unnamed protein product [Darwinula stevensoni]CAG0899450.1 unnamed protein product [Darwinula stevensoni]
MHTMKSDMNKLIQESSHHAEFKAIMEDYAVWGKFTDGETIPSALKTKFHRFDFPGKSNEDLQKVVGLQGVPVGDFPTMGTMVAVSGPQSVQALLGLIGKIVKDKGFVDPDMDPFGHYLFWILRMVFAFFHHQPNALRRRREDDEHNIDDDRVPIIEFNFEEIGNNNFKRFNALQRVFRARFDESEFSGSPWHLIYHGILLPLNRKNSERGY